MVESKDRRSIATSICLPDGRVPTGRNHRAATPRVHSCRWTTAKCSTFARQCSVWPAAMTLDQVLALAVVLGMVVLFVWDRLRYDLVALLALLVAMGVGIVPPDKAFSAWLWPFRLDSKRGRSGG